MSSLYQDKDKLKKHCELQWNSKIILAQNTIEGTEEEKQKVLDERIKKFHLYNTPELQNHSDHEESFPETSFNSFSLD